MLYTELEFLAHYYQETKKGTCIKSPFWQCNPLCFQLFVELCQPHFRLYILRKFIRNPVHYISSKIGLKPLGEKRNPMKAVKLVFQINNNMSNCPCFWTFKMTIHLASRTIIFTNPINQSQEMLLKYKVIRNTWPPYYSILTKWIDEVSDNESGAETEKLISSITLYPK